MEQLSIIMAGITAVILFIFGLEHFSAEIEKISGEQFRRFLGRATNIPIVGVMIGALVTAVIQSSSATSVITISLVNAGVLSFRNSVGIIFGSNIGTTLTAQLVAFKLTSFAPLLIILGFAMTLTRSRASIFGKSIFYFGFVFFSLNLISDTMSPLRDNELLVGFLMQPQHPLMAIFIGCIFTAMVQSSSVTTALAIIFTQQGFISLENAIPLIMGANIGTTITAFLAVLKMDIAAKKTALAHFLFNVGGVLIFAPVFLLFSHELTSLEFSPEIVLANVHLVFNVATSLLFVAFLGPFTRLVDKVLGEGKMDFERVGIPVFNSGVSFDDVKGQLQENLTTLLVFLQENYNQVTLSIETNYQGVFESSSRRLEYLAFLEREYMAYFSRVVGEITDEEESRELLDLIRRYDYLFQIHDSIEDLFTTKKVMNQNYVEIRSDILLLIREIASQTLVLFDEIHKAIMVLPAANIDSTSRDLMRLLDKVNKDLLALLATPGRRDAGGLTNFVTYSRRLQDKLMTFARMEAAHPRLTVMPAGGDGVREEQ
jgi:phosphate:Na+ symporter